MADEPTPTSATDNVVNPAAAPAGSGVHDNGQDRIERFRAEVAELGVRGGVAGRERVLLRLGVALMAVGVIWVIVSYFVSHSTRSPLEQRDMFVSAVLGLTIAVIGGVVFLRYSVGRFLRFWLARLSFDQERHADAVVDALQARARPATAATREEPAAM